MVTFFFLLTTFAFFASVAAMVAADVASVHAPLTQAR
jgi:hypothetical protein